MLLVSRTIRMPTNSLVVFSEPYLLPWFPLRFEATAADPDAATREPWQRAEPAFFWNRSLAAPLLGALRMHCCAVVFFAG